MGVNTGSIASFVGIAVGAIIFLILVLIYFSVGKLNSDQLGIQYNTISKTLGYSVDREGLNFGSVGFTYIIFPSIYNTMEFSDITCLNEDGVVIEIEVSYQFKANPKHMRTLVAQFKDFTGYKRVLHASGISAVHDSCANFTTTEFQTDRTRFQEYLREAMRDYCEDLYCELNDLQVNSVKRPKDFESAVKDKEAAKENIRVAENERPRLLLQAETELEQARKQAEIILNNAKTNAKIILAQAETKAKALTLQYAKDLDVYKQVKQAQGLDNEALLSYIAVRAIANSKNEVNLAMKSPARLTYPSVTD